MKGKKIVANIGWGIVLLLIIIVVRYTVAGGATTTKTLTEKELFSMATKDCYKNTAAIWGVEDSHPAVINYCNCYGNAIASRYKGMTEKELAQHKHEFLDFGHKCFADVKAQYQRGGE